MKFDGEMDMDAHEGLGCGAITVLTRGTSLFIGRAGPDRGLLLWVEHESTMLSEVHRSGPAPLMNARKRYSL